MILNFSLVSKLNVSILTVPILVNTNRHNRQSFTTTRVSAGSWKLHLQPLATTQWEPPSFSSAHPTIKIKNGPVTLSHLCTLMVLTQLRLTRSSGWAFTFSFSNPVFVFNDVWITQDVFFPESMAVSPIDLLLLLEPFPLSYFEPNEPFFPLVTASANTSFVVKAPLISAHTHTRIKVVYKLKDKSKPL